MNQDTRSVNRIKFSTRAFALLMIVALLMVLHVKVNAQGITEITSTTFKGDLRVSQIHIGSDVTDISKEAFRGLNNLREITVSENNPYYASYSGCLYDKGMTELICYPPALPGAVIPSTVTSISLYALHGVPQKIKQEIVDVVESQAQGSLKEIDIPGAHFIHGSTGVMWKQEDGTVINPDSNIKLLAASVVEASSTGSMTQSEQLQAAFDYLASSVSYVRSTEVPTGDWVKEYAMQTLSTKSGNCYGYAASFAYIAKGLGYDARVCTGTVESAYGGRTAHAWTEVRMGKNWYIFDTEMQRAKGQGYYKQTYNSYPAGPIEKEASWTVSFQ